MRLPSLDLNDGLTAKQISTYSKRMEPEREKMRAASRTLYDDDRASINLPLDEDHIQAAKRLVRKHRNTDLLIVIGIGGSNLGTMAVHEAILGKMHNLSGKPRVLYADTVDPDSTDRIAEEMERTLRSNRRVVLNVVSKSGGTTETLANAQTLLKMLKRHRKRYEQYVVVTTGEGSRLWMHAQSEGFTTLPIPDKVGGRYSVFSLVGLFPLALLGIDIEALLEGAAHMRARCLRKNNPAMQRAAFLAHWHSRKRNIADNFYFASDLESVGKWYRQLMGESIGKEYSLSGKKAWTGITPTVSIGTTDLHSMAQLYFGGPSDKMHTIYTVREWDSGTRVPGWKSYEHLVPNIRGRSYKEIMDAVVHGVTTVFRRQRRPFCTVTLQDKKERSIGALLQMHMMEMIYLAALLNVNPFDQPNVEAYKTETKRALGK